MDDRIFIRVNPRDSEDLEIIQEREKIIFIGWIKVGLTAYLASDQRRVARTSLVHWFRV
jgi:hypothetical protein